VIKKPISNDSRVKRHERVRKHVTGTAERPRLNVFRSLNNIYAQIIDDTKGVTLVSASTLDKELKRKQRSCQSGRPARCQTRKRRWYHKGRL